VFMTVLSELLKGNDLCVTTVFDYVRDVCDICVLPDTRLKKTLSTSSGNDLTSRH